MSNVIGSGKHIIVSKEVNEIIERLSICWSLKDSFKEDKKRNLFHRYSGKSDGLFESLRILGLTSEQICYLERIESKREGV